MAPTIPSFDRDTLPGDPADWPRYRKTKLTSATRIEGPFEVLTSEGALRCQDGYLCIDARGYPYPVHVSEFEQIYEAHSDEEDGFMDETRSEYQREWTDEEQERATEQQHEAMAQAAETAPSAGLPDEWRGRFRATNITGPFEWQGSAQEPLVIDIKETQPYDGGPDAPTVVHEVHDLDPDELPTAQGG